MPSNPDRSYFPVAVGAAGAAAAAGVSRSGSNKLKKNPPGDPWLSQRTEVEKQYPEVIAPSRQFTSDRASLEPGPSRDTAFGSHPQVVQKDKELPVLPQEARQAPANIAGHGNFRSLDEMDHVPVRRGTLSKMERLTGQKFSPQTSRNTQLGNDIKNELVTVNGVQYAVPSTVAEGNAAQSTARKGSVGHHHHISDILHHNKDKYSGQNVYVPSTRLNDWTKGGVALLSGELLELEINDKVEADKDKTWWEAGNTGKRRRSSTKQRKAEAYDGEYDDTNGMALPNLLQMTSSAKAVMLCEPILCDKRQKFGLVRNLNMIYLLHTRMF